MVMVVVRYGQLIRVSQDPWLTLANHRQIFCSGQRCLNSNQHHHHWHQHHKENDANIVHDKGTQWHWQ